MSKFCLIRCPSPFLIDEKVFPPLGLMAVGTALKNRGHKVVIKDDIQDGFDYYGIGPTTPEYPYALEIRKLIKGKIIIGGPHATLNPEECLRDGFDYVVVGGLSNYPLIDRTLVDIKSYKYFINGKLATTMMTSFGCPYKCAFCCKTDSFKMRNAEDVIEEIRKLHSDFGYKAIMFFDDIFILDKERTEKICDCLRELGITWRCFVRGDLLVKHGIEFVKMMADSGCAEVGMGIESGSDTILSVIDKGETVETIKTAIKMLHDAGRIRVKGFFIVGLPSESLCTIKETKSFLRDVHLDDTDFTIFQPYVGSKIWKNKNAYDIQWDDLDYKKMFYKGREREYQSLVWTSGLSQSDIVKARAELAS